MAPRGAQRQAILLAREWQRAGHEVHIFTAERASPYAFDDILSELPPIQVTPPWAVHIARGGTLPGSNLVRLRHTRTVLRGLAQQLERDGFDIIHAHNHPSQWIASETRIPVVWTCNEPPYWHYYPTLRNKLADPFARLHDARNGKRLRAIMVLDSRMAGIIGPAYRGVPIHTVGSGAETPGKLPPRGGSAPSDATPFAPERYHVFSVLGGLHHQKRPLDHVEAVGLSRMPDATLHLVGQAFDGIDHEMNERAKSFGVDLRMYPKVSEAHLAYMYANADAALFLPENQPWGIFPLESLLAGVPVILSDEVGARDVLPKDYPFVVPTGDTAAAGRMLAKLRLEQDHSVKAVETASQVLARDYSWAGCARRSLTVLHEALGR